VKALRSRLNDPQRYEYVLCGWACLMTGALLQINDAAVALGWVAP
jgi:hypothetical protein